MAITLGDAIVYIKGDSAHLNKSLDSSEKQTKTATQKIGGYIKTGITTAAVAGAAAVVTVGAAMGKLAFEAMPIEGIRNSFQGLNVDADAALDRLREGSLSMVTDAELMRTYNEAAQLVGKSFADDLPDAMGYLAKVSASTGQDMGFMLDSLTKGVGRLSPMILDNLGIQVDLAEANQVYADSIGKSVDELTKSEQQTALMNQVMEKLAENTAAMPDITDNASTKWAQFQTTFKNLKNELGEALLPTLTSLLTIVGDLAKQYGPMVIDWAKLAITWLGENLPVAIATIKPILDQLIPGLMQLAEWLWQLWSVEFKFLGDAITFVGDNFNIFGPILGVIAGLILALTAPVSLVIAAIVLLATAWANNWGDIQGKTQAALDFIQNIIQVVLDAVQKFWAKWGDEIMALVDLVWGTIKTVIKAALDTITFVIQAFAALIRGDWQAFGDAILGIWRTAWDAIKTIISNAKDSILTIISGIIEDIKSKFDIDWGELGAKIVSGIKQGIEDNWGAMIEWFKGKVGDLWDSVKDFFGIDSPSRIAMSIGYDIQRGLAQGLTQGERLPVQAMRQSLSNVINNYTFTQNVTTSHLGNVAGEFQQAKALIGT
jgi:phage-related protein